MGNIYPPCDVDRFLGRDEWQIKGLEAMMMAGGDDVIRFLRCTYERVTSVGVVSTGMLPILVIGLLDCVGCPSERYHWLNRLSWGGGGVAGGPSNERARRCGCLPRGSQDRVYKERATRELFT